MIFSVFNLENPCFTENSSRSVRCFFPEKPQSAVTFPIIKSKKAGSSPALFFPRRAAGFHVYKDRAPDIGAEYKAENPGSNRLRHSEFSFLRAVYNRRYGGDAAQQYRHAVKQNKCERNPESEYREKTSETNDKQRDISRNLRQLQDH